MITLKFKKLHPDAQQPVYATEGAACFDLHAVEADKAVPHPTDSCAMIFRTGLAFEIRKGYAMQIFSRSGQGFKDGVRLSNCVGIIDSDYRGEVMVSLRCDAAINATVEDGDRIAQAWIVPVQQMNFFETQELSDTARGTGGFGSTSKV